MRWGNLPLSLRLTAVYVGLVAVLLVADGAVLLFETREFLIDSTATRMRDTAGPRIRDWVPGHLTSEDPAGDLREHAQGLSSDLTSPETIATVIDAHGRVLADGRASAEEESIPVDGERLAEALRGADVTYLLEHAAIENLVTLIPLRTGNGEAAPEVMGVVQLRTPLTTIRDILGRELVGIVVVVTITVCLAGVGGYFLTTRALLPLRRVIETCRQIAAGDLSQRVVLPTRRDEVGQVGTAFNQMATRIEAAFEVQRRFVRDAAHELRTPLTALQGAMEVLLRGSYDDPAAARLLLRATYNDIVRLTNLTEQLLDTARLDAAIPLHRQEVALESFLEDQARNARLLNPTHGVVKTGSGSAVISIDVNLLGEAVLNLLENAARHSPAGSTIRLGRGIDADSVRIWVSDEGEGIAPQDLPRVFQTFYRIDPSRSRQRGGAGIGLALVEAIVAAHGGSVRAESTRGVGSTFTITLPALPVPIAPGPLPDVRPETRAATGPGTASVDQPGANA